MQDKAGEIGEMIRELIILEIQKLWKEKKEEWMEQFEQRLRSLEEKSSTFPKQNVVLNQPRQYRSNTQAPALDAGCLCPVAER